MPNKAYFEDGHSEDITEYKIIKTLLGDQVIFKTESGIYRFRYEYAQIDRHLFAKTLSTLRIPKWFKLNDNFEWDAKPNLITHISIYEFKEQ